MTVVVVVSLTIAVARPETGPAEKVILVIAVVGLLLAARLVQRPRVPVEQ
jgi:hypothetical protein